MYAGAVCGLRVRLAVKNSIAIVLVGVLPCTQLADAACGCGLRQFSIRDRILPQAASHRGHISIRYLRLFGVKICVSLN